MHISQHNGLHYSFGVPSVIEESKKTNKPISLQQAKLVQRTRP